MGKKSTIQRVNELLNTNYVGKITKDDWINISAKDTLSEDFIREFQHKVDWNCISKYQKLSESFIREFQNKVNWSRISIYQKLSEDFIREFQSKVDWLCISMCQKLSEDFVREFESKLTWCYISECQELSEDFIREFKNNVNWNLISESQKLSESFIREFKQYVNWDNISMYQKLSEDFIREFQSKVDWLCISMCQKLSEDFIREFENELYISYIKDSWYYKTTEEKKQAVMDTNLYECHEDYFIAYKGIRSDRYSKYNFQYRYEKGGVYESWCDCSSNENSFGLSVWDKGNATSYCKELVVRVKVKYEDVGRVVHNGGKVRCFKIEILD